MLCSIVDVFIWNGIGQLEFRIKSIKKSVLQLLLPEQIQNTIDTQILY